MEGVIGVVTCFAGNFTPKFWLPCNGQSLAISTNQPLFAIIGTTFGGDGVRTFSLPDLRGRAPVSATASPSEYQLGAALGSETVTISANMLPAHTHSGNISVSLPCNDDDGIDPSSINAIPSLFTGAYSPAANCNMAAPSTNFGVNAGPGLPVNICSPYLVVNYIICISGIFPSRN